MQDTRAIGFSTRNDTFGFTAVDALELHEDAPCGYHALNADGDYLYVNRTEARMLGYEAAALLGRRFADFLTADSATAFRNPFRALVAQGTVIRGLPLRLVRQNGLSMDCRLTAYAVHGPSGEFRHAYATLSETAPGLPPVAERVLDANPDLVVAWDFAEGRAFYTNAPTRALLGDLTLMPPRSGRLPFEDNLTADDLHALQLLFMQIASARDGEAYEADFAVRVTAQVRRQLRCRVVMLARSPDGSLGQVLLIAQDVTERRDAETALAAHARKYHRLAQQLMGERAEWERRNARLADLAATDGLTGLLNHVAFQERLEAEFQAAVRARRGLCLLLMDVDHFKALNDTWGHPTGDRALQSVARCLRAQARGADVIARYGGEEFAVILPDARPEDGRVAAERFRRTISAITADVPRRLTVSIGLASLTTAVPDRAALIAAADRALYAAKRRGRDCVASVEG